MLGITTTNARVGGFRGGVSAEAKTIYNRIIADGGVSNLSRLNFFVKGLKAIYGDLANVPVCYDAHWIGYKLGSGTGATAGQAAAKLYSLTVAGDAVQSTAASQPLLLAHNGDNYFYVPRVDGNNCTTPDTVASRIAGDIEIISYIELKGTEADRTIVGKGDTSNANYILAVSTSNIPYFVNGDLISKNATAALPNVNTWLRVTRVSSTGDIKFWTSTDAKTTAPLSVNWTQLGTTISGPTGARTTTTGVVTIGKYSAYTGNSFNGSIFRVTISNSIGGAPVVDFNPATYNASTSQTAWTSSTGEVWTINTSTATTGYKGVLVDRTIVQGDYINDSLSSSINRSSINTTFIAAKGFINDNTGSAYIAKPSSGTANIIIYGTTGTFLWMNAYASNVNISRVVNALELYTITNNSGVNNAISKNNGAENTNTYTPNNMGSGLVLMSANFCLNSYIESSSQNSSIEKTAMYNFIKTLNNNAF